MANPDGSGGLCTVWTDAEQIAICCGEEFDPEDERLPAIIEAASSVLYGISGSLYHGECETTIRPCSGTCECWGVFATGDYYWYGIAGYWRRGGAYVGCQPVSAITLPGAPIRAITEVKIDGDVLDPAGYMLYQPNQLVRMRDPAAPGTRNVWPGCQMIDLEDTEPGTFAVTYTFGADPPPEGIAAATALACELWKDCNGEECALPEGTTKVVRQGVTIEVNALAALLLAGATGIAAIDTFVAAHGGDKAVEVSTVWSPDIPQPERPGPASGS